jgi:hypothetical protein
MERTGTRNRRRLLNAATVAALTLAGGYTINRGPGNSGC